MVKYNSITTDSTGKYHFTGVPDHAHAYPYATKEGYALSPERQEIPDATRVTLWPAGKITGRVLDKQGRGVPKLKLHATADDFRIHSQAELTTDGNGAYTSGWMLPAVYSVQMAAPAELTGKAVTGVSVKEGETAKASDILAVPGAFVKGRVVDAKTGKPVTSGNIVISGPMTTNERQNWAIVDKNGKFESRVYPGKIMMTFQGGKGKYAYGYPNKTVQVSASGMSGIKIPVPPADAVVGKVVDEKGAPVVGAQVWVNESWHKVTSDANGRFEAYLPPRQNEPWMDNERQEKVIMQASDAPNQVGVFLETTRDELLSKKSLILKVRPAHKLTLTVKTPDGKPVENFDAWVLAMGAQGSSVEGRAKTDAAGNADFYVYDGGVYYPSGNSEGYYYGRVIRQLPKVGSKEWTGTAEMIVEPATRTQKGRVIDENGDPLPMARVELDWNKGVRTDANGEFVMEGLPDSRVDLNVRGGQNYGHARVDKTTEYVVIQMKPLSELN